MAEEVRRRVEVRGIVQGVGFRPTVHRLARELRLGGFVANDADGLVVEVEGRPGEVERFLRDLAEVTPPLAVVEACHVSDVPVRGDRSFAIAASAPGAAPSALVPPDVAPCADCLREMDDPADRRHGHAFVSCTVCGPRYSIVRKLPYDRPGTTMSGFPMCDACSAEYADPNDRRHHSQPTCCPACGPRLALLGADGAELLPGPDAAVITAAAARLRAGEIVAVKGLGGYHLAVDAGSETAVARLRARKERDDKPFAVLVAGVEAARAVASVSDAEARLLAGPERPIVLVPRRSDAPVAVAAAVAPASGDLGLLLPPTPLHLLLARAVGRPIVLTSGNRSHEPMVHDDADVVDALGGIADAILAHDRPIDVRVDDSVVRVMAGRPTVLRRSRGHVPRPLPIRGGFPRPVLACGADLKSTLCAGRDHQAVLSEHLGDLDEPRTRAAYEAAADRLCRLLSISPRVVAHDLHPDMASTAFALDLADAHGAEALGVQHHHAHVASCLADNEHEGPVIGVAFDGFGLGPDGTAWGGELLVADLCEAERVGHLRTVALPGGDAAAREPWRMAVAHLDGVVPEDLLERLDVHRRNRDHWRAVRSVARDQHLAMRTSSAGRLFDAVAALAGVRDVVGYEGQAAIELEQLARTACGAAGADPYPVEVVDGPPLVLDTTAMVAAMAEEMAAGAQPALVAARFHRSVVELVVTACVEVRALSGLTAVALSGGVFQNALLVEGVVAALGGAAFDVLTHRRVPPNDGGISLGQAAVAGARDRRRRQR